jgi:ABC-type uncharacterized transport system ATPase subunit
MEEQLSMSVNTVLQAQRLKKYYRSVRAVEDVSFEVRKGEIFGFLGPNGAGKTTTTGVFVIGHQSFSGCGDQYWTGLPHAGRVSRLYRARLYA